VGAKQWAWVPKLKLHMFENFSRSEGRRFENFSGWRENELCFKD